MHIFHFILGFLEVFDTVSFHDRIVKMERQSCHDPSPILHERRIAHVTRPSTAIRSINVDPTQEFSGEFLQQRVDERFIKSLRHIYPDDVPILSQVNARPHNKVVHDSVHENARQFPSTIVDIPSRSATGPDDRNFPNFPVWQPESSL